MKFIKLTSINAHLANTERISNDAVTSHESHKIHSANASRLVIITLHFLNYSVTSSHVKHGSSVPHEKYYILSKRVH